MLPGIVGFIPEEMEFFNKFVEPGLKEKLQNVLNKPFAKVTHKDAIDILLNAKVKFENLPKHGQDINTEHEKYLTEKENVQHHLAFFHKYTMVNAWTRSKAANQLPPPPRPYPAIKAD